MERPANTDHPIHELLSSRWSSRNVDPDRPITDAELMALLEAARWAPSSFNEQPWRYLIFDQSHPDALRKARECLTEGNAWAKAAPVLLLAIAKETFTRNGKPNRHHAHDVGAASISIALQGAAMGLIVHEMAGFNISKSRAAFEIPDDYVPLTMIVVAHHLPDDQLSQETRERLAKPRSRRHVSEIASRGGWDSTLT